MKTTWLTKPRAGVWGGVNIAVNLLLLLVVIGLLIGMVIGISHLATGDCQPLCRAPDGEVVP